MKVRWTSRCAGGCGLWLVVGSRAERRHRGLWCSRCYARHWTRCGRCREQDARTSAPAPREPALF